MKSKIDRRHFLKASGLAAGLPWLEYFAGQQAYANTALTATGHPKRLFIVFNGLGTVRQKWYDANDPNYKFGEILKPLEAHRSKMTIIRGLNHTSTNNTHESTELAALTGQPYVGDRKTTKFAAGISIDQRIANVIGQNTLHPSMSFSLQGKDIYNPLSHKGHSQPNFPIKNPYQAFDNFLAGSQGGGSMPTRAELLQQRRNQVLRDTNEQYKALQARIGQDDKVRLQQHIASLDELVARLDRMDSGMPAPSTCSIIEPGSNIHSKLPGRNAGNDKFVEIWNVSSGLLDVFSDVAKSYIDIAAQAFACDLCRVAVMDMAHFHGHGSHSHNGDPNNRSADTESYDKIVYAGVRAAQNVNYLVNKLSSIPEGNGTMMDNSLIYWIYSHADGFRHDRTDSIDVLIGNAGGMFNTGRLIKLDKGLKRPHNELLTSIANCYGLNDTGFGKNDWRGRGRLTELGVRV